MPKIHFLISLVLKLFHLLHLAQLTCKTGTDSITSYTWLWRSQRKVEKLAQ